MTIDIAALDLLPETHPIGDLAGLGLGKCTESCWLSCGKTCKVTEE